jgi:hypothetical protein
MMLQGSCSIEITAASLPRGASDRRFLRFAFGLYMFGRRGRGSNSSRNRVRQSIHPLPLLAADFQLFVLGYSTLDRARMRNAPLDSMHGLLPLLDAVLLGRHRLGGVSGGRNSRDLVGSGDDVGLVAGSSGEVVSGLDGSADVLDRSDGEVGTLLGGHGLLLRCGGSARLLENRVGLVKGSGRGSGVLDGRSRGGVLGGRCGGVVLLNGSAGELLSGLLADVSLVDGGLLGAIKLLLGQADVLRGDGAGSFHGLVGVLGGDFAELLSLLVGDLSGVVEVGVDELLVGDVDQRSEVDDAGGDEEQAPLGSDLDEEVADQSSEESLENVSVRNMEFRKMRNLQQWWPRRSQRRECAGTQ